MTACRRPRPGILEVADVFVVNKADRDGAGQTVRELKAMMTLGDRPADAWRVPVVSTVASRGEGLDELVDAMEAHHAHLTSTGGLEARRRLRAAREVEALAVAAVRARVGDLSGSTSLAALAQRVVDGTTDPYEAADQLLTEVAAG